MGDFEVCGRGLKGEVRHEMGDGPNLVHTIWVDAALGSHLHEVVNTGHRAIKAEVICENEVGAKDDVALDLIGFDPRQRGLNALLSLVDNAMLDKGIKGLGEHLDVFDLIGYEVPEAFFKGVNGLASNGLYGRDGLAVDWVDGDLGAREMADACGHIDDARTVREGPKIGVVIGRVAA